VVVVDNLDIRVEGAEDGVVLDEVGRLLDTAGVVDGDDLEVGGLASVPAAEEVAACGSSRGLDWSAPGPAVSVVREEKPDLGKKSPSRQLRSGWKSDSEGAVTGTHRCGRNR
jgi:hypothetical protein